MKVAAHQPNYLPYLGYFQKMARADIFVIMDTVQFSIRSFTQRVKIRTKEGWMWLTIPIEKKNHFKPIRDVLLPASDEWKRKHRNTLLKHYSKCPFFDAAFVNDYYTTNVRYLHEFNEKGIQYLKEKFGIKTEIVIASEIGVNGDLKSTELLIDIVKKAGGDVYISGTGGKKYMNEKMFEREKIKLEYFEFQPVEYPQRWEGFEPYMSAIDFLFNTGGRTLCEF